MKGEKNDGLLDKRHDLEKSLCMVEISQIRNLTDYILLHKIHFDDTHTSLY